MWLGFNTSIGTTSNFDLSYQRRASIPLKRIREAFESDCESDESGADESLNQSGFSLDTSLGTRSTEWYEHQMQLMEQRHQEALKAKDAEIAALKAELEPVKSLFKPIFKPRARQNHVDIWLRHNREAIHSGSVKQSYERQIQRYQEAFTLNDAMTAFEAESRQ